MLIISDLAFFSVENNKILRLLRSSQFDALLLSFSFFARNEAI